MEEENCQMPATVQVAIRIRPLLENERINGHTANLLELENETEIIVSRRKIDEQKSDSCYKFDKIFKPQHTQEEIYIALRMNKLIKQVLDGYHATVFAYGQTGSGKTHTMEGYHDSKIENVSQVPGINLNDAKSLGIAPRIINDIYREAKQRSSEYHITMYCSFLQIYNEKVFDLLNDQHRSMDLNKSAGLRLRWNKQDQFQVENLYIFECESEQQMKELYQQGVANRVVASHNLNQTSSRSHVIFSITIESINRANPKEQVVSKLQLVDLAGSEKSSLTGIKSGNKHHKESININKSLFVLRKVINALTKNKQSNDPNPQYIPYRDSKLTSLLKQSLGGNSYTVMIACLNPSDNYLEENISTLKYASRAAKIKNRPVKNVDEKSQVILQLKARIKQLEQELKEANDHIQYLTSLNQDFKEDEIKNFIEESFEIEKTKVEETYKSQNEIASQRQSIAQEEEPYQIKKEPGVLIGENQTKELSTADIISKLAQEYASKVNEHLNSNVNKVAELLKINSDLRDDIEKLQKDKEFQESKMFNMNLENENLVNRIENLERILATFSNDKTSVLSQNISLLESLSGSPSPRRQIVSPQPKKDFIRLDHQFLSTQISEKFDINDLKQIKNQFSDLHKRNSILDQNNNQLYEEIFYVTKPSFLDSQMGRNVANEIRSFQTSNDGSEEASPTITKNKLPVQTKAKTRLISPKTTVKPEAKQRRLTSSIFESPIKLSAKQTSVKEDSKKNPIGGVIDQRKQLKTQKESMIQSSRDVAQIPSSINNTQSMLKNSPPKLTRKGSVLNPSIPSFKSLTKMNSQNY